MFNKTALTQDGFKFKDLSCCYQIVTGVELSNTNLLANDTDQIR